MSGPLIPRSAAEGGVGQDGAGERCLPPPPAARVAVQAADGRVDAADEERDAEEDHGHVEQEPGERLGVVRHLDQLRHVGHVQADDHVIAELAQRQPLADAEHQVDDGEDGERDEEGAVGPASLHPERRPADHQEDKDHRVPGRGQRHRQRGLRDPVVDGQGDLEDEGEHHQADPRPRPRRPPDPPAPGGRSERRTGGALTDDGVRGGGQRRGTLPWARGLHVADDWGERIGCIYNRCE